MYFDRKFAAEYLGLKPKYFNEQVKRGHGPEHLRPSQRVRLFTIPQLDAWKASWIKANPENLKI